MRQCVISVTFSSSPYSCLLSGYSANAANHTSPVWYLRTARNVSALWEACPVWQTVRRVARAARDRVRGWVARGEEPWAGYFTNLTWEYRRGDEPGRHRK